MTRGPYPRPGTHIPGKNDQKPIDQGPISQTRDPYPWQKRPETHIPGKRPETHIPGKRPETHMSGKNGTPNQKREKIRSGLEPMAIS